MSLRAFDPSPIPNSVSTVQEIIDYYLAHLRRRCDSGDFGRHTFDDIQRELKRFAERHGHKPVTDCRRYDLTQWIDSHPEWKSNWTRKRILATVVRPFLWAEDEELIATSPYRPGKMKLPALPRRPMAVREYVTLMRKGSRSLRRALFFLRRTGTRTCEMREVLWSNVDLDRCVIVLDRHKTILQQQNPRPRIIGLEPCVRRFLRNLLRQSTTGHVFTNCYGTPWNRHTFARHMKRQAESLGLDPKLTAYCLRHSYGTWAIEAGVGEKQVADQMGHTTTRMVSYYAQTAGKPAYLRRVAADAVKRPPRTDP